MYPLLDSYHKLILRKEDLKKKKNGAGTFATIGVILSQIILVLFGYCL